MFSLRAATPEHELTVLGGVQRATTRAAGSLLAQRRKLSHAARPRRKQSSGGRPVRASRYTEPAAQIQSIPGETSAQSIAKGARCRRRKRKWARPSVKVQPERRFLFRPRARLFAVGGARVCTRPILLQLPTQNTRSKRARISGASVSGELGAEVHCARLAPEAIGARANTFGGCKSRRNRYCCERNFRSPSSETFCSINRSAPLGFRLNEDDGGQSETIPFRRDQSNVEPGK